MYINVFCSNLHISLSLQEFVDYNGGPGVQHIALRTFDIIKTVTNLKARGQLFLTIPKTYYVELRKALKNSKVNITEDMDIVSSFYERTPQT